MAGAAHPPESQPRLEDVATDSVRPSDFWKLVETLRLLRSELSRIPELEAELQRLKEAAAAQNRDSIAIAEENARLRQRRALTLAVESSTLEGGLAGRSSLQLYRNTNVGKFIEHVNKIGDWALTEGVDVAMFFAQTMVLADLECLFASPPASPEEDQRRAHLEWWLKNPATLRVLCGTEAWNESQRRDFIAMALSAGVDTSTWEIFRRSPQTQETGASHADGDGED